MKKYLFIALITLFVTGCKCAKPVVVSETETVTITETLRDTTIIIERDASMMQALLECDENNNVIVRELFEWQSGKHIAPPRLIIRDNIVTVTAEVDSFAVYIAWKQREKVTANTNTIVIKENELTGWQWFQVWAGRIATCILAVILAIIIIKNTLIK